MALTWRNVDAPDLTPVSDMMSRAQLSFQTAFDGFSDAAKRQHESVVNRNSLLARQAAMTYTDPDKLRADIQAGLLPGLNTRAGIDATALTALEGRPGAILGEQNTVQSMDIARQENQRQWNADGRYAAAAGRDAENHAFTQQQRQRDEQLRGLETQLADLAGQSTALRATGKPEDAARADEIDAQRTQLSTQFQYAQGVRDAHASLLEGDNTERGQQMAAAVRDVVANSIPEERAAYVRANYPQNQWEAILAGAASADESGVYNLTPAEIAANRAAAQNAPQGGGAFLSAMDHLEGNGNYNTLFGNSQGQFGVNVSEMTIGEVLAFQKQRGEGSYAEWVRQNNPKGDLATPAGRFQIVGDTLERAVREMGLDPNTRFDANTQNAIAIFLAKDRLDNATTPEGKRAELRAEWDGFNKLSDPELDAVIAELEGTNVSNLSFGTAAPVGPATNQAAAAMGFDPVLNPGTLGNVDAGGLNFGGNPALNAIANTTDTALASTEAPEVTTWDYGRVVSDEGQETLGRLTADGDARVQGATQSSPDQLFMDSRGRMQELYSSEGGANITAVANDIIATIGGEEGDPKPSTGDVQEAIQEISSQHGISLTDAAAVLRASITGRQGGSDLGAFGYEYWNDDQVAALADRIGSEGGLEALAAQAFDRQEMQQEWEKKKTELAEAQRANQEYIDRGITGTAAAEAAQARLAAAAEAVATFDWSEFDAVDQRKESEADRQTREAQERVSASTGSSLRQASQQQFAREEGVSDGPNRFRGAFGLGNAPGAGANAVIGPEMTPELEQAQRLRMAAAMAANEERRQRALSNDMGQSPLAQRNPVRDSRNQQVALPPGRALAQESQQRAATVWADDAMAVWALGKGDSSAETLLNDAQRNPALAEKVLRLVSEMQLTGRPIPPVVQNALPALSAMVGGPLAPGQSLRQAVR